MKHFRWNLTSRQMILLAFFSTFGIVCKRFIAPLSNLLTDFLHVPGGSFTAGFSLLFLGVGVLYLDHPFAGSIMGILQGLLALFLGIGGGIQGALFLIPYWVPGLVMDVSHWLFQKMPSWLDLSLIEPVFLGMLANFAGCLATNLLIFHLTGVLLALWVLLALFSGSMGGWIAGKIVSLLKKQIQQ